MLSSLLSAVLNILALPSRRNQLTDLSQVVPEQITGPFTRKHETFLGAFLRNFCKRDVPGLARRGGEGGEDQVVLVEDAAL